MAMKTNITKAKREAITTGSGVSTFEYQDDAELAFLDDSVDIEMKNLFDSDAIYMQSGNTGIISDLNIVS